MGKAWDKINEHHSPSPNSTYPKNRNLKGVRYHESDGGRMQEWHLQWLREAHRVLQPGGAIKAFGGTRTFHRLAAAMEAAGFVDIRIEVWTHGSGFPKSLNIGKAIDRSGGAQSDEGTDRRGDGTVIGLAHTGKVWAPVTEEAQLWEGWGTANKPAWEPVVVGRKENPGISSMDYAE